MSLRKYANLTGASRATAWRDLRELLETGLLESAGHGRGTYYNLAIAGWGWEPRVET